MNSLGIQLYKVIQMYAYFVPAIISGIQRQVVGLSFNSKEVIDDEITIIGNTVAKEKLTC